MSTFTTTQNTQIQEWITENRDMDSFVDTLIEWVNDNTKKKRAKSPAKDVDPDRVKRPVPASWMYREDKREEIIRDHFDGETVKGSIVAKKAQELWAELSDEDKLPYEEKRKELWTEYKRATPCVERKEKVAFNVNVDEEREVPEGWEGPHKGTYLHKYVKGLGKKVGEGRFETFAEALDAASQHENCGGITMGKSGYTLRAGCEPQSVEGDVKDGPFTSWTKSGFVPEKKEKKAKKAKKSEKKEKTSGKSEKKEKTSGKSEKKEKTSGKSEKKEKTSGKSEKKVEPVVDDSNEVVTMDENNESEEEVDEYEQEVAPWEYNGEDYLVDEETNEVYSPETELVIGKRTKKLGKGWKLNLNNNN
jgi:hypothetical protein